MTSAHPVAEQLDELSELLRANGMEEVVTVLGNFMAERLVAGRNELKWGEAEMLSEAEVQSAKTAEQHSEIEARAVDGVLRKGILLTNEEINEHIDSVPGSHKIKIIAQKITQLRRSQGGSAGSSTSISLDRLDDVFGKLEANVISAGTFHGDPADEIAAKFCHNFIYKTLKKYFEASANLKEWLEQNGAAMDEDDFLDPVSIVCFRFLRRSRPHQYYPPIVKHECLD